MRAATERVGAQGGGSNGPGPIATSGAVCTFTISKVQGPASALLGVAFSSWDMMSRAEGRHGRPMAERQARAREKSSGQESRLRFNNSPKQR